MLLGRRVKVTDPADGVADPDGAIFRSSAVATAEKGRDEGRPEMSNLTETGTPPVLIATMTTVAKIAII